MVKLLKTYFKRFLPLFIASFALTVCRVCCELMVPSLMSDIVDTGIVNGDIDYVMATGGVMLLWAVGALVADLANSLCAARAAMGMGRDLRSALYARVSGFGLDEVDGFGTSSLITRTTNDVQQLERFVQMSMTMAMMSPIMLVGAATASWNMNSQLALVVFAAIPVIVVCALFVMRLAMPLLRSLQARIDKLNRVTREGLTGIRVIRAYRRESYEEGRFSQANRDLADTNVSVARRVSVLMPLITLILNLATITIVWVGAQFIEAGSFQVGDLMAIIQYAMHVLMSAMMLSGVFMIWPRAAAAGERIREVLDREPTVTDPDAPVELDAGLRARAHSVRFENVSFSFPGADAPALKDVSFTLEPGKTYALIGATGAGKTTVINLLERFYDPTSGRVLVDGVDVASLRQADLRSMIAYAPQKTVLFAGSVADNIRYGNAQASDAQVEAAARAAAAYDFVMARPEGFDMHITQAGGGLSGGQKQRISIARALCMDAGLYIFDDSFSALDFKTDAQVRSRLKSVTNGATVLIVAQRVSVAMDADQVIVLDEGRIDAVGTHEELVVSSEVYREIVASQIEGEVN